MGHGRWWGCVRMVWQDQFAAIASLLECNQQELIVKTEPPGHIYLAEAMKNAAARLCDKGEQEWK